MEAEDASEHVAEATPVEADAAPVETEAVAVEAVGHLPEAPLSTKDQVAPVKSALVPAPAVYSCF